MLSVRDTRRARSKSPGGRDRDRSHSRDTRPKSPPRKENKKSSRKKTYQSESSSSEESDRRSREKKSSRYYDEESEDDRHRHKKSLKGKYSESESEESDKHNKKKSSSRKYESKYELDSDERKHSKRNGDKRPSRRSDESESESDHRRDKVKKAVTRTKKYYESGSESSEESNRHRHSHAHPPPPSSKHSASADRPQKYREQDRDDGRHASHTQPSQYVYAQPSQFSQVPPGDFQSTRHGSYVATRHEQEQERWARMQEDERRRYGPPAQYPTGQLVDDRGFGRNTSGNSTIGVGHSTSPRQAYASPDPQQRPQFAPPGAFPLAHSEIPDHHRVHSFSSPSTQHYIQPENYQYAQIDQTLKYSTKNEKNYVQSPEPQRPEYRQAATPQFVEAKPSIKQDKKHDKYGSPPDPGLAARISHLAVGGTLGVGALGAAAYSHHDGGRPPASPLLEAYHGTYQSISPMPSPLHLASHKNDSDLSDLDLSQSESDSEHRKNHSKSKNWKDRYHHKKEPEMIVISPSAPKGSKRVSFYDPVEDAKKISAALSGTHHAPQVKTLIVILPHLSTDEILALRSEYKNHAKTSGKGINMAKHIKMRVPGNLGKAAYATALGRWESEAYWANSWYQGGASRRELLIESLMGRSNSDIREIKNCFKDKRYGDDLEKCMKAELKADKFRMAILLALEERRMAESQPLELELVKRDVIDLHRALTSREGGESAMIQLIVVRSDAHLREVLRVFEKTYQKNFARDMIAKSRNLVGETLAHILNGALNRPMRDALLLHQAISETAPGKERAELLISRLVRLHWEPKHLERVKVEYQKRYRTSVEGAIRKDVVDIVKGEEAKQWGEFCIELARSSSN